MGCEIKRIPEIKFLYCNVIFGTKFFKDELFVRTLFMGIKDSIFSTTLQTRLINLYFFLSHNLMA